jgi:peptidoglycan/LPS O-acetylase OafA/YrhL
MISLGIAAGKPSVFFKNLDGVRAIAAFLVVLNHIELYKDEFSISKLHFVNFGQLGSMGVNIFFVLSGFLITYLLLVEKQKSERINFTGFYRRRILRIWPLYFFVLLFGFFIFPRHISWFGLSLSLVLFPNLASLFRLLPNLIQPVWSIGIEEQFYLVYPHFLRIKNIKSLLKILVILLLGLFALNGLLFFLPSSNGTLLFIRNYFYWARYDNLLIGAITAILLFNKGKNKTGFQNILNYISTRAGQIIIYFLFCLYLFSCLLFNIVMIQQLIGLISAGIIYNICSEDTSIISLNNKVLIYLGKISYGIYLLNAFVIYMTLFLFTKYIAIENAVIREILIYFSASGLTILFASVSFFYFEKYFLNLKKNYTVISTTEKDPNA